MKFQGALVKEQGVTFAVVVVKKSVLENRSSAEHTIQSFRPIFTGVPIVLMAQDSRGTPSYFGRKDIVNFLSRVPMSVIPWREYTIS